MKRPILGKRLRKLEVKPSEAQSIDEQFGLEPVIDASLSEDDRGSPGGIQFHVVECPYCGECAETAVDASSGSARYVEDCQICCQPIEFSLEVDHAGVLQSLSTLRRSIGFGPNRRYYFRMFLDPFSNRAASSRRGKLPIL